MRRKALGLIAAAACGMLVAPLGIAAQQPKKIFRVGVLALADNQLTRFSQVIEKRLAQLGHVAGENLVVESVHADGKPERLPALAAELVRRKVDVILAAGIEASMLAAKQATSTIPIVIIAIDYDPLARGHVKSLARPGGNITGIFVQQPELTAKRLELFKEALPGAKRVAVFWDKFSIEQLHAAETVAPKLGVQLQRIELGDPPYDFAPAFAAAAKGGAQGLMVLASPIFYRARAETVALALKHRLPGAFALRDWVEPGGLMSYGVSINEMYLRGAYYIDRILKGTNPSDLPVEQPTKFELVVNLKTAKALGVTLPPAIMVRADEVIQ